jgi:hypothetical protein
MKVLLHKAQSYLLIYGFLLSAALHLWPLPIISVMDSFHLQLSHSNAEIHCFPEKI